MPPRHISNFILNWKCSNIAVWKVGDKNANEGLTFEQELNVFTDDIDSNRPHWTEILI